MLVIATPEAAFKLDNSHFVVDGNYADGYTYDREVFFMEGIKDSEWCKVGACCHLWDYVYNFKEVDRKTDGIISQDGYNWDAVQRFEAGAYTINLYSCGIDQLFVVYYGTEYLGKVGNDIQGDGFVMSLNQALRIVLNPENDCINA